MRGRFIFSIILLFASINLWANPKDSTYTHRPKVGIVLSGGGAKGFAHLGALKVIEQSGVQIDYIGGTSIGAIVGGLYAAGYSVDEIDSLFHNFDIINAINYSPDRKYMPFYEKRTEGKTWFKLGFDKFKIRFPSAISNGQGMINLLTEWTIPVHHKEIFEDLHIPFYAKATDLSTGESVRMDSGFLPEVMRASGTFPTLLSPFMINEKLYVDGGVLDNYPIDEMKRRGADIIIGVDISAGLTPTSELNSLISIMDQLVAFQGVKSTETQLKHLDINITPDISKYTAMSFSQADSIYVKGLEAAQDKFDELKRIAQIQQHFSTTKKDSSAAIKTKDSYLISHIAIEGNDIYPEEYFLGRFNVSLPHYMPLNDVKEGVDRLYATGNFVNVYYRLIPNTKDKNKNSHILKIIVRENANKKFIGVGWSYDKLYSARLLLNMKLSDVFRRSILETDVVIGFNPSLKITTYRDNGRKLSFGGDLTIGSLNVHTFVAGIPSTGEDVRVKLNVINKYATTHIYMQSILRQQYSIGVGLELSYLKAYFDNINIDGESNISLQNTYFISPYAYLSGDSRNNKFFPTKGTYYNILYKMILSPDNGKDGISKLPSVLSANISHSINIGRGFSINLNAFAGLSLGTELPYNYKFFPGGVSSSMPMSFVEFYGLPFFWNKDESSVSLGINNFSKLAAKIQYSPTKNQFLYAVYNYGWIGKNKDFFSEYSTVNGMGMGYGIDTPIGPLQLTGTYSPSIERGPKFGLFFSAGYSF